MAGGFLRVDKKFGKPKCNKVSSKSLLSVTNGAKRNESVARSGTK